MRVRIERGPFCSLHRQCLICGKIKSGREFYQWKSGRSADVLKPYCKRCDKEYAADMHTKRTYEKKSKEEIETEIRRHEAKLAILRNILQSK